MVVNLGGVAQSVFPIHPVCGRLIYMACASCDWLRPMVGRLWYLSVLHACYVALCILAVFYHA